MKKKDIELVLRNPRFPTQFIMQVQMISWDHEPWIETEDDSK